MARFYDATNSSDLERVEGLLKKNGIVYTLRVFEDDMALLKEIQVAEEDLNAAEKAVEGKSCRDN
ncbi:MAG: hypothetical protein PHH28_16530 [Desulfuromonadaceae bacterium]|nr:hypothetical protein [Desulfuromonadaceae bacterium]